ncbi:tripartite tricarboxylate transporter permease [Treponema parvum]|uniref:Tripartite tricarboxylate transporter permease n=1 Tax=Treponema parvum TaxID=138851 RepID=A0A975F2E5_9SPIR|nr:tripartite tricarboxylate transporter permease [Treponema parvum]QTQ13143.1 tripartite tricarboxylate transporter permease [Treponema parvum]
MDLFIQGFKVFFNIPNFIWMNIGLLLGVIFGAVPGLTVILCIVLFLPLTYTMNPIESFMFLLGIYCAGGYGGSISAILIKTPGTPHAAATMIDGYPMSQRGQSRKALNIALQASTFGGFFSALALLFFAPQFAKFAQKMGTPEYFLVCLFGLTIIAGVSGKSLVKGIISGALGLFISSVGLDPVNGQPRYIFGNINLYSGFDIVICLIGIFALSEILARGKREEILKADAKILKQDKGKISKAEYKLMALPSLISAAIGVVIGIIPGTGATMASFFSYNNAKNMSKTPEKFGDGAIEGIAAAETANNAVTGATLIPLLTMGIPGDGCVAIMLGALMVHNLTPGPNLFVEHGVTMYAIMIGLLFVNLFMFLQGRYLTGVFAKVINIPLAILTPIIVMFCFAGAFSVNTSTIDIFISLCFALLAYVLIKVDFPTIPILLGLVLGDITEENFRRSLVLSDGSSKIFASSPICIAFIALIALTLAIVIYGKIRDFKKDN